MLLTLCEGYANSLVHYWYFKDINVADVIQIGTSSLYNV